MNVFIVDVLNNRTDLFGSKKMDDWLRSAVFRDQALVCPLQVLLHQTGVMYMYAL